MSETESDSRIPVSWVSVHHKPLLTTDWSAPRGRMMSMDDGLLSDVRNRHSLYHYEEYNIDEEDDDVFMDSVDAIVTQHRRGLASRHLRAGRISSDPDYHTATLDDTTDCTSNSKEDISKDEMR